MAALRLGMQTDVRVGELTPNPRFLQGLRGFTAWLGFAKPRPVYKAPALRAFYRGRRERLPPRPLAAGGEKELRGYLRPSKLTRSALASASRLLRSRPYCSGALGFANIFCSFPSRLPGSEIPSLAPCALGGDRLAISVGKQKLIETI